MTDTISTASGTRYEVHTEARGPHWIAWLTRESDAKPVRSVVLVGATEDEARDRVKDWAERTLAAGYE